MLRYWMICLCLFVVGILYSQDLPQMQLVGTPEKSDTEMSGVRDGDGNFCAGIKVISNMNGFAYTSNNGVVKLDDKPGVDVVHVSADERVLDVMHTGYEPLRLILREEGIHLSERDIWVIKIRGEAVSSPTIPVVFSVQPADARIEVDDQIVQREESVLLSPGEHQVRITKEGYEAVREPITVSLENNFFKYKLEEVQNVPVEIITHPSGATVYLDDMKFGETTMSDFYPSGRYPIRIEKDDYVTYSDILEVKTPRTTKEITLEPDFGDLSVESEPETGLEIFLNGESQNVRTPHTFERLKSGEYIIKAESRFFDTWPDTVAVGRGIRNSVTLRTRGTYATLSIKTDKDVKVYLNDNLIHVLENIRLEPMIARVRVEHIKAEPIEKKVALKSGDEKTIELYPEIPTGAIQVAVLPLDCNIEITGDAGEIYHGQRSQMFSDIPVGEYTVKVTRDEYQSQEIVLKLDKGAKERLKIELEPGNETGTMVDQDGNTYKTVKIGEQWWMAENLRVKHYRNGELIPKVESGSKWEKLSNGAYCYYKNQKKYSNIFGYLYNWYAVNDKRNIAPKGWHVPTDEEWKKLEVTLGMSQSEAFDTGYRGKNEGCKLAGIVSLWEDGVTKNNPDFGSSELTALPGGYRNDNGKYAGMGKRATFWLSSDYFTYTAWFRIIDYDHTKVYRFDEFKKLLGRSVRCVRD